MTRPRTRGQSQNDLPQGDPVQKTKGKNVLPGSLATGDMVALMERLRVRMDRGILKSLTHCSLSMEPDVTYECQLKKF